MLIALWLLCTTLFLSSLIFLIFMLSTEDRYKDKLMIIKEGIFEAFRNCGLIFKKRNNRVELYQWVTAEDESVCSNCYQRSLMAPMDIIDWMEEGLPRTPEARTLCKENCRCSLIIVKTKEILHKD